MGYFTSVRSTHALSERMCAWSACMNMSEDLCVRLVLGSVFLAGVEGDAGHCLAVAEQAEILD